jgi:AhpD family alkylhydroperoxidase
MKQPMESRLDFYKASPEALKALIALEVAIGKLNLDPLLVDLVKLRASQINGCAYCVDLHASDARKKGETERRLYALPVWRETPLFTARERAALAWTEAVTSIAGVHPSDEDYDALRSTFSQSEMVNLTLAIGVINTWNRLAISFRKTLTA